MQLCAQRGIHIENSNVLMHKNYRICHKVYIHDGFSPESGSDVHAYIFNEFRIYEYGAFVTGAMVVVVAWQLVAVSVDQ